MNSGGFMMDCEQVYEQLQDLLEIIKVDLKITLNRLKVLRESKDFKEYDSCTEIFFIQQDQYFQIKKIMKNLKAK